MVILCKSRRVRHDNFHALIDKEPPPLHNHILKEKVIKEMAKDLRKSIYLTRKLEQTRCSMLKYQNHSASLGNFRKKEEEKVRIPVNFFQ